MLVCLLAYASINDPHLGRGVIAYVVAQSSTSQTAVTLRPLHNVNMGLCNGCMQDKGIQNVLNGSALNAFLECSECTQIIIPDSPAGPWVPPAYSIVLEIPTFSCPRRGFVRVSAGV